MRGALGGEGVVGEGEGLWLGESRSRGELGEGAFLFAPCRCWEWDRAWERGGKLYVFFILILGA